MDAHCSRLTKRNFQGAEFESSAHLWTANDYYVKMRGNGIEQTSEIISKYKR